MLTAIKPVSIGDRVFDSGDPIPPDIQASLPPGRVVALTAQRYVEERGDELVLSQRVAELEARLAAVEGALGIAPKKRRTRKAA